MAGYKLHRKEGFSLIEVLIALVILAIGLLGLALFQTTAIKGNAIAAKWTVATGLAQDRLERFRHAGWTSIQSSVPAGFVPGTQPLQSAYSSLGGGVGDNTVVRGTTYFRVWDVTPATTTANTLTTITVWCCWLDEFSKWHNVMLVAQRTNAGGI
jgi:type IV pilus assembly protein PilV